jgi:hypothetical protein
VEEKEVVEEINERKQLKTFFPGNKSSEEPSVGVALYLYSVAEIRRENWQRRVSKAPGK